VAIDRGRILVSNQLGTSLRDYNYVGAELDLFAKATMWKAYFRSHLKPYLGREVLEVGAGQGSTTRLLCGGTEKRWVCLEPDAVLVNRLLESVRTGLLPTCCHVVKGTVENLATSSRFDTILYIDVLEHIDDDKGELSRAAEQLSVGGHIVVLSPAHQWLYTSFDKAIGHYRRYNKRTLAELTPARLEIIRLLYLDSIGLLASLSNRLFLDSAMPTRNQIAVWDNLLVRVARLIDPLLFYAVGKSVLGIWRKH
jgi:hypothetical protein